MEGIAYHILNNAEDSEECVNDTYLKAWGTMPDQRPGKLSAFLGKIIRNLSFNRWESDTAEKRGGGRIPLEKVSEVLFGLRSSISDGKLAQTEYIPEEEAKILAAAYFLDAGYEISPEQFSVTAQMAENQGKVTWNLKYEEIESTDKFIRRYYVLLDAVSGERISVDIGR